MSEIDEVVVVVTRGFLRLLPSSLTSILFICGIASDSFHQHEHGPVSQQDVDNSNIDDLCRQSSAERNIGFDDSHGSAFSIMFKLAASGLHR